MLNPEPEPPDVELGQSVEACISERHAVVGPDRQREPELAERLLEDRPDPDAFGREQRLHPEQIARVLIGDGQREAVDAVPRAKLALEVSGPEIIWRAR